MINNAPGRGFRIPLINRELQLHAALKPIASQPESERATVLQEQLQRRDKRITHLEAVHQKELGRVETLQSQLSRRDERIAHLENQLAEALDPSQLIWIFSSGRSGTTWVRNMLSSLEAFSAWEEPRVGQLLGGFTRSTTDNQRAARNFIFGEPHAKTWLSSLRQLVLDNAAARFATLPRENYLVVKEPNGSEGAPLLSRALPESRLLTMIRDPRDVVASTLDARREGGWQTRHRSAVENEDAFVSELAANYARNQGGALSAHDSHAGPKTLLSYEALLEAPRSELVRATQELGLNIPEDSLDAAVELNSWDSISEEEKGRGKFYRKATPGGWREDLTKEQVATVENVCAPFIQRFYS